MKNREKLIKNLNVVINALKSDIVYYNWASQDSCNCGVVAQAMLGVDREKINIAFHKELVPRIEKFNESKSLKRENKFDVTWKSGVQVSCSVTGEPLVKILKQLKKAGLTPEDITHLEFMDNPAIINRSNIKTHETYVEEKKVLKEEIRGDEEYYPNLLFKLFNIKKTRETVKKVYVIEKETVNAPITNYYNSKDNLIKYLSAWVQILTEETSSTQDNLMKLEEQLLVAVSNENYELASNLRDQLVLVK